MVTRERVQIQDFGLANTARTSEETLTA